MSVILVSVRHSERFRRVLLAIQHSVGDNGMARDEGLEELLTGDLEAMPGLVEKAMFGGQVWMLNGNLLCGARDDGLLARLGKGRDGWALEIPGVVPMISRGRQMRGWVRAAPEVYGDDDLRRKLLDAAFDFNRTLPAK